MKRITIAIIIFNLFTPIFAQSESRWSIALETGTTLFDGDIDNSQTFSTYYLHRPSFGVSAEFKLWKFMGFGFGYSNLYLRANNGIDDFKTILKEYYPYVSIYPLSLFGYDGRFKVSARAGVGFASYGSGYSSKVYPVGLGIEYGLNQKFSLYVRSDYSFYNKDYLECIPKYNWKGITNDRTLNTMLGVKYNIGK